MTLSLHPPLLLVVDDTADVREPVTEFMAARGVSVERVESVALAQARLEQGGVEVLAISVSVDGWAGLTRLARERFPGVHFVALVERNARDLEAAMSAGALRVLTRPLSLLELADAVRLALDARAGLHGRLHRLSLVDLLQMYHHAAQSVHLLVHGAVEGELSLMHGELVHAHCQDEAGAPALARLLTVQSGFVESLPMTHLHRTLSGPFDHLLLDALRALDEQQRDAAGGDDDLPADWLGEPPASQAPKIPELQDWLSEHAPGAGLWRIDVEGPRLERIDNPGGNPENELGGTPGSIGWAYELAERADASWTRVELVSGAIGVALVRIQSMVFAFARLITGDAVQRRFHAESARLASWLTHHLEAS